MRRLVSVPWSTLFGSLFVVLTCVGIFGNVIVILAIGGDKKLRKSVMNILLLNLAAADIMNLVVTTMEWTHTIALGYPAWPFPTFLCPTARYLECIFLFMSILTQLGICLERYIAIIFPMHVRHMCTKSNVSNILAGAWIFVGVFCLPYAFLNEKRTGSRVCTNPYSQTAFWLTFKWIEFFSFYCIPCILFVALYSKVASALWIQNRHLYEESNSSWEQQARIETLKRRRSVVKMLIACVCVYFACYSPIQAIFLTKALFNISFHPPYEFVLLMNALALMCSACNPLIYTLFSKKFRIRVAQLLGCGGTNKCGAPENEVAYGFNRIPDHLPDQLTARTALLESPRSSLD